MARISLLLTVWIGALPAVGGAQDFDDVQIEVVDIAGGIHMLLGSGGNIGVSAGADGVFLVDDQFAPLTDKIRAAVRGITDGPLRFVLNTHWHGDHTGGNENLGKAGVLIVAHENVRERMSVDQFMEAFNRTVPAAPEKALPVVTFTDAVTFYLNGDEIRAFHVPAAHTDGDALVHFRRANVVHMGDTFFNGRYPFVDLASGGSVGGVVDVAELALAIIDGETKVIPGHGPLGDKASLRAYRDMIVAVRSRVSRAVDQGQSIEQVLASKPTADFDGEWRGNAERFVRIVYDDLK